MTGKNISTFVKVTDLTKYFDSNLVKCCNEHGVDYIKDDAGVARLRRRYEREQKVTWYVLSRYEGGKFICEIKCPINPLPVIGEFTAAGWDALRSSLETHGWEFVNTVPAIIIK